MIDTEARSPHDLRVCNASQSSSDAKFVENSMDIFGFKPAKVSGQDDYAALAEVAQNKREESRVAADSVVSDKDDRTSWIFLEKSEGLLHGLAKLNVDVATNPGEEGSVPAVDERLGTRAENKDKIPALAWGHFSWGLGGLWFANHPVNKLGLAKSVN